MPLLADIVLAADTAAFQDSAHFPGGLVPGDGVHVVYPMLLGVNRARYFLLTGQVIHAAQAKELGLVAEVLPPDQVLPRAWELARMIAARPEVLVRHTRAILVESIKRQLQEYLPLGLYNECLGLMEHSRRHAPSRQRQIAGARKRPRRRTHCRRHHARHLAHRWPHC
jgi:enoyl-CoA hydratase/carnithine racemase